MIHSERTVMFEDNDEEFGSSRGCTDRHFEHRKQQGQIL